MHLFIATPVKDTCSAEMVEALERACAELRAAGYRITRQLEPLGGVVVARNLLAASFLHSGADVLLFVDSDVAGFTADDVRRIVESGKNVVGAPLPGRSFDPERIARAIAAGAPIDDRLMQHASPLLFWEMRGGNAELEGTLLEVEAMGTGFLAISRQAIERVGAKLPVCFLDDRPLRNVFDFLAIPGGALVGEDAAFSARWRALGGRVWADTLTSLVHVGRCHYQAPPLAGRLVASRGTKPTVTREYSGRTRTQVDLVGFRCPDVLAGDALAVARGEYELEGLHFVRPPVVLDIGANVGAFVRWARARWAGAVIHAYEPHPELAEVLEHNARGFAATVTRAAVGRAAGVATLTEGRINACQSTLHADVAAVQGGARTFEVIVADAAELPAADVLKIDTEGAELEILARYLATHAAPRVVALEFHRREDRRELETLAERHGLELVKAQVAHPACGLLWFAPALDAAHPHRPEELHDRVRGRDVHVDREAATGDAR